MTLREMLEAKHPLDALRWIDQTRWIRLVLYGLAASPVVVFGFLIVRAVLR